MLEKDFVDPAEVLDQIDLDSSMTAADFGTGSGHWSLELARRLSDGVVYAIDISGSSLSHLKSRKEGEYLPNIIIQRRDLGSGLHSSRLPSNSVDLVLVVNILFQVEDEEVFLKEAQRVLKEGGYLLIVDWVKPLNEMQDYFSPQDIKQLAEKLGLELDQEFKAGEFHRAFIYTTG